jgi:hypothetical protein
VDELLNQLREVTGPEAGPAADGRAVWWWVAGLIVVSAILALARLVRRKPDPLAAACASIRAATDLAELNRASRQYLALRYDPHAGSKSTPELRGSVPDAWAALLDEIDRLRFGAVPPRQPDPCEMASRIEQLIRTDGAKTAGREVG